MLAATGSRIFVTSLQPQQQQLNRRIRLRVENVAEGTDRLDKPVQATHEDCCAVGRGLEWQTKEVMFSATRSMQ